MVSGTCSVFADDVVFYFSSKKIDCINTKLQEIMNNVVRLYDDTTATALSMLKKVKAC